MSKRLRGSPKRVDQLGPLFLPLSGPPAHVDRYKHRPPKRTGTQRLELCRVNLA
jgi:hypothetical protein